jgi:hypothetical protein
VHALRHVHGLLVPGGTLVDLHPVEEERVEARAGPVGVIEEPQFVDVDLPNAEARLAESIRAGLYAFEAEETFEVIQHFDETDDLLDAKREPLAEQPALVERIRASSPPLLTRERAVLRRLRARRV